MSCNGNRHKTGESEGDTGSGEGEIGIDGWIEVNVVCM